MSKVEVEQHVFYARRLVNAVKAIGCALVFKLGAIYIASQLVAANSQLALMVQGFFFTFFLFFLAFASLSFRRVWKNMSMWLSHSTLVARSIEAYQSHLARAIMVVFLLPFASVAVLLSVANQLVRRLRGIPLLPEEEKSIWQYRLRTPRGVAG